MPKLEAFKVDGLILKFNSLDHLEAHFHALKPGGKWEIRVYFLTCTEDLLDMAYKKPPNPPPNFEGISKSQRKDLLKKVLENRVQLLLEWEKKVQVMENFDGNAIP